MQSRILPAPAYGADAHRAALRCTITGRPLLYNGRTPRRCRRPAASEPYCPAERRIRPL